ncbi:MAG: hypothetical protein ACFCD0_10640 [Gemmataceae bacterium]
MKLCTGTIRVQRDSLVAWKYAIPKIQRCLLCDFSQSYNIGRTGKSLSENGFYPLAFATVFFGTVGPSLLTNAVLVEMTKRLHIPPTKMKSFLRR